MMKLHARRSCLAAVAAGVTLVAFALLTVAILRVEEAAVDTFQRAQRAHALSLAAEVEAELQSLAGTVASVDASALPPDPVAAGAELERALTVNGPWEEGVGLAVFGPDGELRGAAGARMDDALRPGWQDCQRCELRSWIFAVRDMSGSLVGISLPRSLLSGRLGRHHAWVVGPDRSIIAHHDAGQIGSRPFEGEIDPRLDRMLDRATRLEPGSATYSWRLPDGRDQLRLASFAPLRLHGLVGSVAVSTSYSSALAGVRAALTVLVGGFVAFLLAALGAVLFIRSEALRHAREQQRMVERQLSMQQAAEHKNRLASIGTVTAGLAHDISGPLTVARMAVAELRRDRAGDEEMLSDLAESVEDLIRFAEDLTLFSGGDRSEGVAWPPDVARTTLRLVGSGRRKVELQMRDMPPVAMSAQRLSQVLLNLVQNALGYAERVILRGYAEGKEVVLVVEDDGPGIPSEVAERLYEPFVTTREAEGAPGLGLFLCHQQVETVGGSIHCDRGELGGARIILRLPIAIQGNDAWRSHLAARSSQASPVRDQSPPSAAADPSGEGPEEPVDGVAAR